MNFFRKSLLGFCLMSAMCCILTLFSANTYASASGSPSLSKADIHLIQSLLPEHSFTSLQVRVSPQQIQNGFERIVSYDNTARILSVAKRSDVSAQVRKIILSIPTRVIWGIHKEAQQKQSSAIIAASCNYAATAHGYIQDTNIYGIVLWSYDVKQAFDTDGRNVCGYGARVPTFYANGLLTWKYGGETYSQGSLPANPWTEINKAFFNPGWGLAPGEVGRISFWMYGGGYWDVSVGYS